MSVVMTLPFPSLAGGKTDTKAKARPVGAPMRQLPDQPVVAFLDNGKVMVDRVLLSMGEALKRRGLIAGYVHHRKLAMVPIDDDKRAQVLGEADVVVAGVGDCGGCTACSVTDALRCLELGVPAFMIATTRFAYLVDATEAEYGLPGLHKVLVDHPIWSRDERWVAEIGEFLADRWAEALDRGIAARLDSEPESKPESRPEAEPDLPARTRAALVPLEGTMAADGYDLAVAIEADEVRITIAAQEGTCPTCLVPEPIFVAIAMRALGEAGLPWSADQIRIRYPAAPAETG